MSQLQRGILTVQYTSSSGRAILVQQLQLRSQQVG